MAIKAKRVDMDYFAGDAITLEFQVTDVDGVVVPLAGVSVRWGLAHTENLTTLLIEKPNGAGAQVTDGASGLFQVTLQEADTAGLAEGLYRHEAEVVVAGRPETVAWGIFSIFETILN